VGDGCGFQTGDAGVVVAHVAGDVGRGVDVTEVAGVALTGVEEVHVGGGPGEGVDAVLGLVVAAVAHPLGLGDQVRDLAGGGAGLGRGLDVAVALVRQRGGLHRLHGVACDRLRVRGGRFAVGVDDLVFGMGHQVVVVGAGDVGHLARLGDRRGQPRHPLAVDVGVGGGVEIGACLGAAGLGGPVGRGGGHQGVVRLDAGVLVGGGGQRVLGGDVAGAGVQGRGA